jgi:4-diphosphocytidyl-2-C-methyl-D-erythritol kinase
MIYYPNAKINLGLNIFERRDDGYHNLETVFYPIPLMDALEVNDLHNDDPRGYTLQIAGTQLDCDPENNLVIKVYKLLKARFQLPPIQIYLYKHIPTGAGLGGGSSDAAFMMRLLNAKYNLGMKDEEMEELITPLGADCAFFIQDMPKLATGIGNILSPVNVSLAGYSLLLVKPNAEISTAAAYTRLKPHRPTAPLSEVIVQPIEKWRDILTNDFEDCIFPEHPEIAAIKDKLYDLGAEYASMSGSGSTVFGIFRNKVKFADEVFSGYFCRQRELMI